MWTWHVLVAAPQGLAEQPSASRPSISFRGDIRPILQSRCIACHGGVKQLAGLSFVTREQALAATDSGLSVIEPGDPDGSLLLERIAADDDDYRMPPADHGPRLAEREINLIRRWIAEGAVWDEHWAFVRPQKSPPPDVRNAAWCRGELDRYVLAGIESAGMHPSPEADRAAWLRRVSFDLTGLPPTAADREAFSSDSSARAFEKVVDRLLASPAYGERWATMWLDLARYADTVGYERDPHRDIWPYRDWVIRALNGDMPFDEFTVKQLAGDLLPNATLADRLATAFHRNTQTNTEGGTDDEEFRVAALLDRVNTTWQVWQGLTFGCAQCHAHPYDPIQQREYYSFAAFFNSSRDADVDEDWPTMAVPVDPTDWTRAEQVDGQIAQVRTGLRHLWDAASTPANQWTGIQIESAQSAGNEQLRIVDRDDGQEVITEGTITARTTHTIIGTVPPGFTKITALRIEVLPKDAAQAERIPEAGFVLSKLELQVELPGDGKPHDLSVIDVLGDVDDPSIDPRQSLDDDDWGWAAYTRLHRPCSAVFIFKEPLTVSPKTKLRLRLRQNAVDVGEKGLVIQRSRYSVSANEEWHGIGTSTEYNELARKLAELRDQRRGIASVPVPIMGEQSDEERRKTFVFRRGNWLDRTEMVSPGVPAIFPTLPDGAPRNRVGLAQWLVAKENPLTARVMVNRLWEQLFGRGIVLTLEDFGSSGFEPTYPELLDFLAVRFRDDYRWSIKRLLREIVLSATYRQSAAASPELLTRDPQNLLLARGPRSRLTAEMIRDTALSDSGMLSTKMYGPPVKPEQPEGVWRSVYSDAKWVTSPGEDRYRRAIYTYWKRTSGYPSLQLFDAPSREVCSARRITTNTPLQALVTLNDPVFFQCAQALARRTKAQVNGEPSQQIAWAYELATGHPPSDAALGELLRLYDAALASNSVSASDGVAREGGQGAEAAGGSSTTAREFDDSFALAVVANAILNLDEALTK